VWPAHFCRMAYSFGGNETRSCLHCYNMRINRNTINSIKSTIKNVTFFKHLSQYKIARFYGANAVLVFNTSHDCHVSIFNKIYLNDNKVRVVSLRSVHIELHANR
jgi:hypothetical protein